MTGPVIPENLEKIFLKFDNKTINCKKRVCIIRSKLHHYDHRYDL